MIGSLALNRAMGTLLAANAATLAPTSGSENLGALIVAPFTPTPQTLIADLTFSANADLAALASGSGSQLVGLDPATGAQIITIKEPAGGWRWILTGPPAAPITVYGFCLINQAKTTLIGAEQLPTPVVLAVTGDQVDIGNMQFWIPYGVIF